MKFRTKLKLLALVCGADVFLGLGFIYTVTGKEPAHVAVDAGEGIQEGGEDLDRARGLEGKCVALTFDDEVIIGLSQE